MERIVVVSDIHGHYDEFVDIMLRSGYRKGIDRLYILGDMVDQGPESIRLLVLIMRLQQAYPDTVTVLLGNHDAEFLRMASMLADGKTLSANDWETYSHFTRDGLQGVLLFQQLFDEENKRAIVKWLKSLPKMVTYKHYIFTHAGVDASVPLEEQTTLMLLWGRKYVINQNGELLTESDGTPKTEGMTKRFVKAPAYKDRIVIFGHSPTSNFYKWQGQEECGIWFDNENYDKIGMDCGVWDNGALGGLEIIIHDDGSEEYKEHYCMAKTPDIIIGDLKPATGTPSGEIIDHIYSLK